MQRSLAYVAVAASVLWLHCSKSHTPAPHGTPDGGAAVHVVVTPSIAAVLEGHTTPFSAAVTGSANTAVSWTVAEGAAGGKVSASGLYTAPNAAGTYHVVATSEADPSATGKATISVTASSAGQVVVDGNDVHQHIDGFGASDAFDTPLLTDALEDLFFSPTKGIGLSILRTQVGETTQPSSYSGNFSNEQRAIARGAKVWAAPWTPPGMWKDNGMLNNGGNLLTAHYSDWAASLVYYIQTAAQNGVPIYAISVQNEPDFTASYESCTYSPKTMVDFAKVLGPQLAMLNPRPLLMLPESSNWDLLAGYVNAIEADATAKSYTDLYATHHYAGQPHYPSTTKPLWETEVSTFDPFDPGINNGLHVAQLIHDAISSGNVSAWHYWWLFGLNSDNEGLIGKDGDPSDKPTMTKRLYTMGNYSKFVRPGFVVIGVSGVPAGVAMTAYKDPTQGTVVIVAINNAGHDVALNVAFSGPSTTQVTPWVTSSTQDLSEETAIAVTNGAFAAMLPSASVTTFVGQ
jgi:glucuronoarabinoxylan endo-1,4-beta-xylanase